MLYYNIESGLALIVTLFVSAAMWLLLRWLRQVPRSLLTACREGDGQACWQAIAFHR